MISAVGRLEDHYKLYLVMSDTRFADPRADRRRPSCAPGQNGLVRLEDVATVDRRPLPQWIRVTADGHDAVIFQVYQQPGGNTVQIARDMTGQARRAYRPHLPAGVTIANWYDQSELIVASAGSVRDAILIGVVLAALCCCSSCATSRSR